MSGVRRWGGVRRASLCRLLLMGLVVAGLFAMHGLQASDGPMDSHGLPLMSMASGPDGSMTSHQAAEPVHERAGTGPRAPLSPTPHHPGGRTCLGLLLVASLLILLTVLIGRSAFRRAPSRRRARLRRRHGGRPPPTPSIFQLSVLRL